MSKLGRLCGGSGMRTDHRCVGLPRSAPLIDRCKMLDPAAEISDDDKTRPMRTTLRLIRGERVKDLGQMEDRSWLRGPAQRSSGRVLALQHLPEDNNYQVNSCDATSKDVPRVAGQDARPPSAARRRRTQR